MELNFDVGTKKQSISSLKNRFLKKQERMTPSTVIHATIMKPTGAIRNRENIALRPGLILTSVMIFKLHLKIWPNS